MENDDRNAAAGGAKRVVLMRGLPGTGVRAAARALAAQDAGEVFAFDDASTAEDPGSVGLPAAHRRHFEQVRAAIDAGHSPLVVESDVEPSRSTKAIVTYALVNGYAVQFAEPSTPWWAGLRPLLADFGANETELRTWARKLAFASRSRRRLSADRVLERMRTWNDRLGLAELLSWGTPTEKIHAESESPS